MSDDDEIQYLTEIERIINDRGSDREVGQGNQVCGHQAGVIQLNTVTRGNVQHEDRQAACHVFD